LYLQHTKHLPLMPFQMQDAFSERMSAASLFAVKFTVTVLPRDRQGWWNSIQVQPYYPQIIAAVSAFMPVPPETLVQLVTPLPFVVRT
jgi:hypothetical protein